jgi:asparagine synthase (glutamine-hydrolysing)
MKMLENIIHRGPDELGLYFNDGVGLASARLSIIDLASGKQPMTTPDGRWWIVFNGEIFNYIELQDELKRKGVVFSTQSDTEVLLWSLVTWRLDALPRLNGQFAFALWDRRDGSLMLARDRYGERPLFIHRGDNGFLAFASEIKGLFALPQVPRTLNPAGLRQACHFWTTLPGATCFQGIESLAPASWAVLNRSGEWRQGNYTTFPRRAPTIKDSDAVALVREKIERAVAIRMRSDVEVALYLSGGLDSSIVSAVATKLSDRKLRTFSVGFRDEAFDETSFQEQVSRRLGTNHHALTIGSDDIRAAFPDVIRHAETVLFRTAPAPMYLLAQEVHRAGIKVVLTGEGADETFLGYDIFKEALFLSQFSGIADDEQRLDRLKRLYPYMPHFGGQQARSLLLFYKQFSANASDPLLSHLPRLANGAFATKLLNGAYDTAGGVSELLSAIHVAYPDFDQRSVLERTQILELLTLLAGYLLSSQGDRMSSAFSVEGRYPFLDPDVSEMAAAMPENMLLRDGIDEKSILKRAFSDVLPPDVVSRPKQPYRAPGASSLRRNGADDWLGALLDERCIAQSTVLDQKFAMSIVQQVEKTPDQQISPRLDHSYVALISVLLLEDIFINNNLAGADLSSIPLRSVDGRQSRFTPMAEIA